MLCSDSRTTSEKCPRAPSIYPLYCRYTNHCWYHHKNFCRWYCDNRSKWFTKWSCCILATSTRQSYPMDERLENQNESTKTNCHVYTEMQILSSTLFSMVFRCLKQKQLCIWNLNLKTPHQKESCTNEPQTVRTILRSGKVLKTQLLLQVTLLSDYN